MKKEATYLFFGRFKAKGFFKNLFYKNNQFKLNLASPKVLIL